MKLPSIFRTPNHKRFNITPRYYDPIKEDIEQRTDRIKKELELKKLRDQKLNELNEGNESQESFLSYSSRISGSFRRNAQHQNKKSGALRFTLIIFLIAGSVGYLYYGNIVLYGVLLGIILIYFLKRYNVL